MHSVTKTVLGTLLLGSILAAAAPKSEAQVWFEPNRDRYARGTRITLAAHTPSPFKWVNFYQNSTRDYRRYIGCAISGWDCVARLSYTVPTDPNRDNVVILAFQQDPCYFLGERRIPIGL